MKKVTLFTASMILAFLSCTKDLNEDVQTVYFPEAKLEEADPFKIYDGDSIRANLIFPNVDFPHKAAFEYLATNRDASILDPINVRIYLNSIQDNAFEYLKEGDILLVISPDIVALQKWADKEEFNMEFGLYEDYAMIAFDQYGRVSSLSDFLESDEVGSLNAFIDWTNMHESQEPITPTEEYDNQFTRDFGTNTLYIGVDDFKWFRVACYSPEKRSGKAIIDYRWEARMLHSYEGNALQGDYYLVTLEANVNSAGMYDTKNYKILRYGVHLRNRGFYAENFKVTSSICKDTVASGNFDASSLQRVGKFMGSPTPATTLNETSHFSGINLTLNADLTGGLTSSGFMNFNATVLGGLHLGNSSVRKVSDVNIYNESSDNFATHKMTFKEPEFEAKLWITHPAQMGVSTATFVQQYLVFVPNVPDSSKERFFLNIELASLDYGICWFTTTRCSFKRNHVYMKDMYLMKDGKKINDLEKNRFVQAELAQPQRIPTGTIQIYHDNAEAGKLFSVTMTETSTSQKYVFDNYTYSKYETFEKILPKGKYDVEIKMGETQSEQQTYKSVSSVKIDPGQKSGLLTSANFKLKE